MLTLRELFDDYLGILGIDDADHAPEPVRVAALADIKAALQLMQSAGPDYYSRETETVTLVIGQADYDLDEDVAAVPGPVRLANGQPLKEIRSRGEWLDFGPVYLGQTSRTLANGTPLAYHVETAAAPALTAAEATGNIVVAGAGTAAVNGVYVPVGDVNGKPAYQKGEYPLRWYGTQWALYSNNIGYYSTEDVATPDLVTTWVKGAAVLNPVPTVSTEMTTPTGQTDSAGITIRLAPPPDSPVTLSLDVIPVAPTYTLADLCEDDPYIVPPVPHNYHESILRPLVRMGATAHEYFQRHRESLPQIERDYSRALQMLGMADPRKKTVSPNDREEAAK